MKTLNLFWNTSSTLAKSSRVFKNTLQWCNGENWVSTGNSLSRQLSSKKPNSRDVSQKCGIPMQSFIQCLSHSFLLSAKCSYEIIQTSSSTWEKDQEFKVIHSCSLCSMRPCLTHVHHIQVSGWKDWYIHGKSGISCYKCSNYNVVIITVIWKSNWSFGGIDSFKLYIEEKSPADPRFIKNEAWELTFPQPNGQSEWGLDLLPGDVSTRTIQILCQP